MPILKSILADMTRRFEAAGIHSPAADAEVIAASVLGMTRAQMKECLEKELDAAAAEGMEEAAARREQRVPLARIFGRITYRGLNFAVEEGVFEPAPETETIIEYTHIFLEDREGGGPLRILDVGSGTGCILLALVAELPHATGIGIDINEKAVELSRKNAEALGLSSRAEFRRSDWFSTIRPDEKFDFVVCYPPFVPESRIEQLQPEVYQHDPRLSLSGGRDGFDFFRRLARDFSAVAAPDGIGIFQMMRTIEGRVARIFEKEGYRAHTLRNHFGLPMCVGIRRDERRESLWQRLKNAI